MIQAYREILNYANAKKSETEIFIKKLQRKTPSNFDSVVQDIHHRVFDKIDCLQCSNCCRTISPMLTDPDIARVSKHLKMKPSQFTQQFLTIDEDHDYVFSISPCPLIDSENRCKVYDVRPRACREYPHTDSRNMKRLLPITLKNSLVCPAVSIIIEELKLKF